MSEEMDRAEQLTEEYLQSLGYTPVFEPNGRDTFPDFEVTLALAAEARFLNEHYFKKDHAKGLQEETQPLMDRMTSVFRKFNAHFNGQTYFVFADIQRPLPKNVHVRKSLFRVLSEFLKTPKPFTPYPVTRGLSVEFIPSEKPMDGTTFLIGGYHDMDSGGSVVSNFIKNLRHCIADKTRKQQGLFGQYNEWWLILTDQIAYGFSEHEKTIVISNVEKPSNWNRIIVLSILTGKVILEF